jgi:hypothetical protein
LQHDLQLEKILSYAPTLNKTSYLQPHLQLGKNSVATRLATGKISKAPKKNLQLEKKNP